MEPGKQVRTFKDLVVWQKAFKLCIEIYKFTADFPAEERYGMTAEMRKTARSIPYNIAEGHKRRTTGEFIYFVGIASGSGGELETQLLLARALEYSSEEKSEELLSLYGEIERMLPSLIRSLKAKKSDDQSR